MKHNIISFCKKGNINIIIDGQFGSTGKGLFASYIGKNDNVDIVVSNYSPNAGHTFYIDNKKHVVKQIPVVGAIKDVLIYLCSDSIIDIDILLKEIFLYNISTDRLKIHPRAMIINDTHKIYEKNMLVNSIASTGSGTGAALSEKILRKAKLAKDYDILKPYIGTIDLMNEMDSGKKVLVETSQGFDLSINSGFSYPHCTSREVTVSNVLAQTQVHPKYLGNVCMTLRTYPIRVGNTLNGENMNGYSGPFYEDSFELSWQELKQEKEYTTNTNRVRRIATFSKIQFDKSMKFLMPSYIFLNFVNYIHDEKNMHTIIDCLSRHKDKHILLGLGKNTEDVLDINNFDMIESIFRKYLYHNKE